MKNESPESLLVGGRTATEVVRIENTVRRSVGPNSEFNHALLKLLEEKNFGHAPRFLGTDEKGREILTFMEGEVPHGEMSWTDDQLLKVIQMLKDFHDATAGSELAQGKEVVCHNDIAPWNTILENDTPTAFIDFDDVAPGNRADDLAYLLWTFLKLGSDVPADVQAERIRKLSEVYGFTDKHKLIDAILEQQEKILAKREELAKNAPDREAREFSASRIDVIRAEIEWVKTNRNILEGAIPAVL
ncbi:MAG: phosphotransferase [bacterium]|nr:phosphotransferase [bacterium]